MFRWLWPCSLVCCLHTKKNEIMPVGLRRSCDATTIDHIRVYERAWISRNKQCSAFLCVCVFYGFERASKWTICSFVPHKSGTSNAHTQRVSKHKLFEKKRTNYIYPFGVWNAQSHMGYSSFGLGWMHPQNQHVIIIVCYMFWMMLLHHRAATARDFDVLRSWLNDNSPHYIRRLGMSIICCVLYVVRTTCALWVIRAVVCVFFPCRWKPQGMCLMWVN